jgi:hypothetical protein
MAVPDLRDVPQAFSVDTFYCANPRCRRPHVVLYDIDGRPFAQFVISETWGPEWIEKLQKALYAGAVERDEP